MFIITNRQLHLNTSGLEIFGSAPNEKGSNELRLVDVNKGSNGYNVECLDDELTPTEVRQLAQRFKLSIDTQAAWYASLKVACTVFEQACKEKKAILFYVHGYNNDMEDVVDTMAALERAYDVVVVGFSWPANGGGKIAGTAAYLSDKRDARASADALNRFIEKIYEYHDLLTADMQARLKSQAQEKFGNENYIAIQEYYSSLLDKACAVKLNLLCHSMGNYLLKYAAIPSNTGSRLPVFDNINLVAADANNEDHENWVEQLQPRSCVYIIINQDDFALKWSRHKPGSEQRARLGHYRKNLTARNASYIDVTKASWVKNSHSYFIGQPIHKNAKLKATFNTLFTGGKVEHTLHFHPDANIYSI